MGAAAKSVLLPHIQAGKVRALAVTSFHLFFFQAEDGIRDLYVTGVQTCALPICNQIFLDHVDQVLALGVLRGGPGADTVRIQVRLAAELIDPLGEKIEMFLFFLRVLSELFLDRLAGESGGADGVELVAENAHDLRGDRVVQEGDGVFHLAPVVLRDGAFAQMLPSPTPNLLDIRKEPLSSTHCLSSLLHDDPFPEASRAVALASHPPPTAL